MVSALTSTRLIAAQLALKTLLADDTSDDSSSSSSSSSSLLSDATGGLSSLPSQSQASLASLLNGLSSSDTSDTASSSSSTQASTDITTASFMTLLKQNLTATAAGTSDGAKQAQAMLDALKAGTLTVSDPTNGVSITAWDPSSTDGKTGTASGNTATSIPTSDWNDYLKAHLQRNADSTFTRAADNSFIDKTTGNEAYFGQVGTQYYYLTWTAPSDTDSDTAAGTPATSAASG